MYWSRVLDVYSTNTNQMRGYNVEDDLDNDKAVNKVRKNAVREISDFLFDPSDYDDQRD